MDYWKDDAVASGATLAADPLILNGHTDDALLANTWGGAFWEKLSMSLSPKLVID